MAILRVPLNPDLPKQTGTVRLAGLVIRYRVRWNSRVPGGAFYLDVWTQDGEGIAKGVRIVPWWPLADRAPNTLSPFAVFNTDSEDRERGALILIDREGGGLTDAYPELDGFEERFALLFVDGESLTELGVPE